MVMGGGGGEGGFMIRHSWLLWRVIGPENNFHIILYFSKILKNM